MKYSEIKKQLQSLQKRAHDAAKDLPAPYQIITEIKESIGEKSSYYCYWLQVWNYEENEPASEPFRSNIYDFWSDDYNLAELEKTITDFLAFVEEIKNANK